MSTSKLFKAVKKDDNLTVTTNGMPANKSTLDACLDLFFQGPACRHDIGSFIKYLNESWVDNNLLTLKMLFYFRDIRGHGTGQGERKIFREGMRQIARINPEAVVKNLIHVPFFGRWDDLIYIAGDDMPSDVNNEVARIIKAQFKEDISNFEAGKPVSLLTKWLPSCNASSKETKAKAKWVREKALNKMTEATYRKTLSLLRSAIDILETHMVKKDYTFDYSKLPGQAALKHVQAFMRNDRDRYMAYKDALAKVARKAEKDRKKDDVKINTATLSPADLVAKCSYAYDSDASLYDSAWRMLPNYFDPDSAHHNWLAVADVSGSMSGSPMNNSIAMALYIAEHNTGIFKDQIISFTDIPNFYTVDSSLPLIDRIQTVRSHEGYNTDLIKVFEVLLDTAKKHKLKDADMPEAIVIITDCQFDACLNNEPWSATVSIKQGAFETIKTMYKKAGYKVPKLVFWNAAQNNYGNVPVTMGQNGVILASGTKPGMFAQILGNAKPADFMKKVLGDERYKVINI